MVSEFKILRAIGPTLLALILAGNFACSGNRQRNAVDGNSQQTNFDQWQPYQSIPGAFRRILVGDPRQPGPFKFQLKVPAKAHVAVHRHAIDVHVKVLSGSMFIIIGEPIDSSRTQRFIAGSVFTVPANTWHEEWWDEETVAEAEGVGPMETVYKSP
jgi:mannose-6-phosphate isomerase-like protein (cupin superfamily)